MHLLLILLGVLVQLLEQLMVVQVLVTGWFNALALERVLLEVLDHLDLVWLKHGRGDEPKNTEVVDDVQDI